jgi:hypothetical protein
VRLCSFIEPMETSTLRAKRGCEDSTQQLRSLPICNQRQIECDTFSWLRHISSEASRLLELLKDGRPHRTYQILEAVYGNTHTGIARIGARIWDIKSKLPEGQTIQSWKDPERPSLWWYQLVRPGGHKLF